MSGQMCSNRFRRNNLWRQLDPKMRSEVWFSQNLRSKIRISHFLPRVQVPRVLRRMVEYRAFFCSSGFFENGSKGALPKGLIAMIGEKLGHYRLTDKIGEGGMGIVYRARDEELNRDVAVKVLAAGMLESLGKHHLLKEAQTASALNHPNICTIYQIGRISPSPSPPEGETVSEGFYLVMELVEGQPLNEMARSTKLTTEAVTRYGVQIADAL